VLKVNRKKARCKGAKLSIVDHLITHSKHTISIQYFKFAHLRLTLLCLSWDQSYIVDPRTVHDNRWRLCNARRSPYLRLDT
jgi:hypothetical protein